MQKVWTRGEVKLADDSLIDLNTFGENHADLKAIDQLRQNIKKDYNGDASAVEIRAFLSHPKDGVICHNCTRRIIDFKKEFPELEMAEPMPKSSMGF